MKAFSDFIAIILFFVTYTVSKNIILATAVAVIVGIAQAGLTYWQHKKLEPMQWLSLILITAFGGLTIILNDRTFIMLKTTILPWFMAMIMAIMQWRGKNSLRLLMSKEIALPDHIWNKLGYTWIIFFVFLGLLNLAIAYPFDQASEATWIQFKTWGYLPLIIIFSLAQGIYLMRHLPKEN